MFQICLILIYKLPRCTVDWVTVKEGFYCSTWGCTHCCHLWVCASAMTGSCNTHSGCAWGTQGSWTSTWTYDMYWVEASPGPVESHSQKAIRRYFLSKKKRTFYQPHSKVVFFNLWRTLMVCWMCSYSTSSLRKTRCSKAVYHVPNYVTNIILKYSWGTLVHSSITKY